MVLDLSDTDFSKKPSVINIDALEQSESHIHFPENQAVWKFSGSQQSKGKPFSCTL